MRRFVASMTRFRDTGIFTFHILTQKVKINNKTIFNSQEEIFPLLSFCLRAKRYASSIRLHLAHRNADFSFAMVSYNNTA